MLLPGVCGSAVSGEREGAAIWSVFSGAWIGKESLNFFRVFRVFRGDLIFGKGIPERVNDQSVAWG